MDEETAASVLPQKLFSAKSTTAWFLGTPLTRYPHRLQNVLSMTHRMVFSPREFDGGFAAFDSRIHRQDFVISENVVHESSILSQQI